MLIIWSGESNYSSLFRSQLIRSSFKGQHGTRPKSYFDRSPPSRACYSTSSSACIDHAVETGQISSHKQVFHSLIWVIFLNMRLSSYQTLENTMLSPKWYHIWLLLNHMWYRAMCCGFRWVYHACRLKELWKRSIYIVRFRPEAITAMETRNSPQEWPKSSWKLFPLYKVLLLIYTRNWRTQY
jgi:hypothetical protein